jgi:hypothetical protein
MIFFYSNKQILLFFVHSYRISEFVYDANHVESDDISEFKLRNLRKGIN